MSNKILDQLPTIIRGNPVIPTGSNEPGMPRKRQLTIPISRPSVNLGHIFNSSFQVLDLESRIRPSNPIPFSVIKTAQTNLNVMRRNPVIATGIGRVVKRLRGTNGSR